MNTFQYPTFDSSLRGFLNLRGVEDLKKMLKLIPVPLLKPTRKSDFVNAIQQHILGPNLEGIWKQLKPLDQSAVAESVHSTDGKFNQQAFAAKYGALPAFKTAGKNQWDESPTLLSILIHQVRGYDSQMTVPADLRERLLAFVPKPTPTHLATLADLPKELPREWTSSCWDSKTEMRVYTCKKMPLIQRNSERAAFQDLRTTLRLIDQNKLSVSSKTLAPSKATTTLLYDFFREKDFFPLTEPENKWDPVIGPIKGFSWLLLVQTAKLASVSNEKLSLTKAGRNGLEAPPAEVLREIWNSWRTNTLFDEFSRIEMIKGQNGKARRHFTPPANRRQAIAAVLSKCPVGRWVATMEFSRFMRAAGFEFQVTRDCEGLYILDPQYGALGEYVISGWHLLQDRYLLCLLFEYAAPLGIVDIAYENPNGARVDHNCESISDDIIFLSRYDGLRYIRLTPLGAYILGLADSYEPVQEKPSVSLTVLSNKKIRVENGELSTDEVFLFSNFADRESKAVWVLNESKALKSIEKGARISEFRALLIACDPQPLPQTVEGFIATTQKLGSACLCKGTALLVECLSTEIADIIARDSRAGKLCERSGDRGLVVLMDKEKTFRDAINALGFGMPLD